MSIVKTPIEDELFVNSRPKEHWLPRQTSSSRPTLTYLTRRESMTNFKMTFAASILVLSLSITAFSKAGTISTTSAGTISTTSAGTISTTSAGTISTTSAGTISTTRTGTISTTGAGTISTSRDRSGIGARL